ncbi:hypothetical protein M9Y10_044316 [Tritrichomonas musculus]|uniref:Auxin Efflux Carrier family protein n=1 Tax=Tritrichomonas musculus TaxID=1915356 RepID=A0ABR2K266_9EUKA
MEVVDYDYLDTFQVALSIVVIVAIGILCGWRRLFTSAQASEIRRALNLICIPGLIFRQTARSSPTLHTWQPFFNGLLVQLTIHIIYAIICFSFPFKNKSKRFMEISCATTSADFIYYSLSMTRFMYGENDYEYIPSFLSLVHFFFLIPFYTILSYVFTKVDKASTDDEDAVEPAYYQTQPDELSKSNDNEEDEVELEEGIEAGPAAPVNPINNDIVATSSQALETVSLDDNQTKSQLEIDDESHENIYFDSKKSDSNNNSLESIDDNKSESNDVDNENVNFQDEEQKEKSDNDNHANPDTISLKWAAFSTLVNPVTVCAVLGVIWSATRLGMVTFLEETSNTLQKSVLGAGLFIIGLFMFYHPFIKFNIPRVILFISIHYIIIPFISIFWSYILKLDSTQAIVIALSHVAPLGIFGSVLAKNTGYKMKCVSYTFFWSNVMFLPIFMCWVFLLKEVTIFSN